MTYFDHNATAPLMKEARDAWLEAVDRFVGNPSSPHRVGARAETALAGARERLAAVLGCDGLDLVWTSGATESGNAFLHHFAMAGPADGEVWVSAVEHPCVLEPARLHFRERLRVIPVDPTGVVEVDWIRDRLRHHRPLVVAVMAANNETGVLQPWREVLSLCRAREVPFACDATQWVGRLPAAGLGGCDVVCGSAHKFGGPKGVGFLKCPARGPFRPLLLGGQQEEGRRSGTENVPGVLSMMAALEAREARMAGGPGGGDEAETFGSAEIAARLGERREFERSVLEVLTGAEIVAARASRLWNTVSVLMPEADCQQRWVVKLDKRGFAVSTGSACSSGREKPSHVLEAMGYPPSSAGRVLRFSGGWETTGADWTALMQALTEVAAGLERR